MDNSSLKRKKAPEQGKGDSSSKVPKRETDLKSQAKDESLSKTDSTSSTSSEPFVKDYPANTGVLETRCVTSDEDDGQGEVCSQSPLEIPLESSSSGEKDAITPPSQEEEKAELNFLKCLGRHSGQPPL